MKRQTRGQAGGQQHQVGHDTMSVDEVARRLHIGRGLAYRSLAAGKLPAIRLGRKYIVTRIAFEKFLSGASAREERE